MDVGDFYWNCSDDEMFAHCDPQSAQQDQSQSETHAVAVMIAIHPKICFLLE
jgi:hypothetical protein